MWCFDISKVSRLITILAQDENDHSPRLSLILPDDTAVGEKIF